MEILQQVATPLFGAGNGGDAGGVLLDLLGTANRGGGGGGGGGGGYAGGNGGSWCSNNKV